MEYDGGMSRLDAEDAAAREMGFDTASALYSDVIASWRSEVIAAPETKLHGFDKLKAVSLRFLASEWASKALEAGWYGILVIRRPCRACPERAWRRTRARPFARF